MGWKRVALGLAALSLLSGLLVACSAPEQAPASTTQPTTTVGLGVGNMPQQFVATTLDGMNITNDTYAGKPYVLFFFASWCTTCRAELQSLKAIYPGYADQVAFLAVDMGLLESQETVRAYAREQQYPWPVALTDGATLQAWEYVSRDSKFAVNKDGFIIYRGGYGEGSADTWRKLFDALSNNVCATCFKP